MKKLSNNIQIKIGFIYKYIKTLVVDEMKNKMFILTLFFITAQIDAIYVDPTKSFDARDMTWFPTSQGMVSLSSFRVLNYTCIL